MYVIRRSDGKFVATPGSDESYTSYLQKAQVFQSLHEAEASICPGNEYVISVEDVLKKNIRR
jgi:hypothetical protein